MTNMPRTFFVAIVVTLSGFAIAADRGNDVKFSGWVIDSACAYTKGLDKPHQSGLREGSRQERFATGPAAG